MIQEAKPELPSWARVVIDCQRISDSPKKQWIYEHEMYVMLNKPHNAYYYDGISSMELFTNYSGHYVANGVRILKTISDDILLLGESCYGFENSLIGSLLTTRSLPLNEFRSFMDDLNSGLYDKYIHDTLVKFNAYELQQL